MKHFAQKYFEQHIYINFDHPDYLDYHRIFTSGYPVQKIIALLELQSGIKVEPGKTLLIFDEIQEVPQALAVLKYFNEDAPNQQVICAGSQMGIALHQNTSFPVGNVTTIKMLPMSFTEFLAATGNEKYAKIIEKQQFELIGALHNKFCELVRLYSFVGGMPEVVKRYAQGDDYSAIRELQFQLINSFRADFSKHAPRTLISKLNMVWDSLPRQLGKENKKFVWSAIRKGARAAEFENAIQWLSDCSLIHKVRLLDTPKMPAAAYASPDSFKVYSVDIGLLAAQAAVPAKAILQEHGIYDEFKGALAEQFVLQELVQQRRDIYYWSGATSEIDFIIQQEDAVIPIEVKSGTNLQAKSLRAYRDKYHPKCSYKLSLLPYKRNDEVTNLPLYLASTI